MSEKQSDFNPIRTYKDPTYDRKIVMVGSKKKYFSEVFPTKLFGLLSFTPLLLTQWRKILNPSEYLPLFIEINDARKTLEFPVGHPVDGNIYGTSEIAPNRYVPISSFHNDMYQSKLSFFMDMCSFLGVKECTMTEMRQNGKTYEINVSTSEATNNTEIEHKAQGNTNGVIKLKGHFSFPKPKHKIEKINSKWLVTEPTWRQMQEIRVDRDISTYEVEFNVDNDFGINSSSLAKFGGNKLNLGGEFKEFTKTSYLYKIEFWEK